MNYSNTDIAQALSQGSEEALRLLFERFHKRMVLFANSLIQSDMESEEVVSDVFLQLWNRRHYISSSKNVEAYLFISVRNACFNIIKKNQRNKQFSIDESRWEELAQEIQDRSLEEEEIIQSTIQYLLQKMSALPDQSAKVCMLYFESGLSTAEIAHQLNIAPQTVLNLKSTALKTLRKTFKITLGWFFL
jgi:RNA polymerase sigma-70 factor (family 1)